MSLEDVATVVAIDQASTPDPWSHGQCQQSLDEHHCVVMRTTSAEGEEILGYAIISTVLDTAEILNITIAPQHQGKGLGAQLLAAQLAALPSAITVVHLEVRVSNIPAICLYHQYGFVEVGRRRDYYLTEYGREDAILMNLARV